MVTPWSAHSHTVVGRGGGGGFSLRIEAEVWRFGDDVPLDIRLPPGLHSLAERGWTTSHGLRGVIRIYLRTPASEQQI